MTRPDWAAAIRARAAEAPAWMRERASAELHIGGFTQARLETPVLDACGLDEPSGGDVVVFFLVAASAAAAPVARIQCSASQIDSLTAAARDRVATAIERVDDANARLMRYFDVYLRPPASIAEADAGRLRRALEDALAG